MAITRTRITGDYDKYPGGCVGTTTRQPTCGENRTRMTGDYLGPRANRSSRFLSYTPYYTSPTVYHTPSTHVYSDGSAGGVLLTALAITVVAAVLLIPFSSGPRCWDEEVCNAFSMCHIDRVCNTLF